MKPHLVLVLAILLLAPLGAIGWLGLRAARDEQQLVAHRFDQQIEARLGEVAAGIGRRVGGTGLALGRLLDFGRADGEALRDLVRSEPLVRQAFVLEPSGQLRHPPLDGPRSESEEEFLTRTRSIWQARDPFAKATEGEPGSGVADRGWYVWYWDRDVNLIFWKRSADGRTLGIEVNRMALLAELIGELPGSDPGDPACPAGRMELVDADGDVLYGWGRHAPATGEAPRAARPLEAPLGSWSLRYFVGPGEVTEALGRSGAYAFGGALGAMALALLGLALYFVRENGRELREARQRMSFVNQVSHELKTPLTNIRMYAELLDDQLDEESREARDYASVIVSESQRLSRLIANVLSFARHQRGKLALRNSEGDVDETIRQVVDQFRPSLGEQQIEVVLELDAGGTARFDADALGQILGNLLSNVEKYAAAGGRVTIVSERDGRTVEITVSDQGPGIPTREQDAVFQPFVRLSGKVTDGVAGTGIGLSIARELARLHGGDLVLRPSEVGACFRVTLEVDDQKGAGS